MHNRKISLLTLFVIATCYVTLLASFRFAESNDELATLGNRPEPINGLDNNQIFVRRLPTSEKFVSRWAVRLPNSKEKRLYANWGIAPLDDLRDLNATGLRSFEFAPDPDTNETFVELHFKRNPNDTSWGSVVIVIEGETSHFISDMTVNPEIISLLMGETATQVNSVSDLKTIRSPETSLTLYSVESTDGDNTSFCLWIDNAEQTVAK